MSQPELETPMPKRRRRDASNPLVFFDVTVDGHPSGRIIFELFKDVVPKVMISNFSAGQNCLHCSFTVFTNLYKSTSQNSFAASFMRVIGPD